MKQAAYHDRRHKEGFREATASDLIDALANCIHPIRVEDDLSSAVHSASCECQLSLSCKSVRRSTENLYMT